MKFFHISDLHFGKMLYDIQLAESDQPYWIDRFLEKVDEYGPDAVVVAGDVYDRKAPSEEAVRLFDRLVTGLSQRGVYVFIIPGNHDSAIRVSHMNELLKSNKIYIAGKVTKELVHVTVPGDPDVTFWLMPYVFPKLISDPQVLDRGDLNTYDAAVRALIEAQDIDDSACNVIIAHQTVLAAGEALIHSDSETYIGGVGEVEYTAFDRFDYAALGHIHNAQKVGRETVRYAGCPMFYDISELERSKALTLVSINGKNDVHVEAAEIPLLHRLDKKTGTLEELLQAGQAMQDKEQYYVFCEITDKHIPPRAVEQLRDVYGQSLIHVQPAKKEDTENQSRDIGKLKTLSLQEQFAMFYQEMNDELMDGNQAALIDRILEQQVQAGDYVPDAKNIAEADSEELVDLLLQAVKEEEE